MTTPEATTETLDMLLKRLEELKPIFENDHRVLAVFLYGSHVDGYAMPWSDIDLAVLYDEDVDLWEHLRLDARICKALGTDNIDWLDLRQLPLPVQHRVIQGRIIYEREPARVSDFIMQSLIRYYSLRHILDIYDREFSISLVHDYDIRLEDSSVTH